MTDEDVVFDFMEPLDFEARLPILNAVAALGFRKVAELLTEAQAQGKRLVFDEEPKDSADGEVAAWHFE